MLPVICGLSILFLIYVRYGYAWILRLLLRTKAKTATPVSCTEPGPARPYVSIVVPCFNEEMNIEKKIRNVFSVDYPKDSYEVIFVDNDSTDATFSLLTEQSKTMPMVVLKSRRRKVLALNEALRIAKGELIVATDCDTAWERNAIKEMSNAFSDDSVGAVCATPHIQNPIDQSKQKYHRHDWMIRSLESRLDTCSSLDGKLMAFRRSVLSRFPEDSSVDDLELTLILRSQGQRCVALPDVHIHERSPETVRQEFSQIRRRVYTVFHCLWNHRAMIFNPAYGYFGVLILPSRRLLPLFVPPVMGIGLISALIGWPRVTSGLIVLALVKLVHKREVFPILQFVAILIGWFDVMFVRRPGDIWCRTT